MVFIILLMAVGVLLLLVEIFLASGAGVAGIIVAACGYGNQPYQDKDMEKAGFFCR